MSTAGRQFFVYIMASKSGTLYVGVTNDLERRAYEHRQKLLPGFTAKYNINRLVYCEVADDARAAIAREKQIKGWLRAKKIELIESMNPQWDDLSAAWFERGTGEILRCAQDDTKTKGQKNMDRSDAILSEAHDGAETKGQGETDRSDVILSAAKDLSSGPMIRHTR